MYLTAEQINSFSLIVYNALSKRRTAYTQRVLTGFNDFEADKCFYRWNSMLNVIYGYNSGVIGELPSGVTISSFIMPNENNTVAVTVERDTDADPSDWLYVGNVIYIDTVGYFQIVSVDGDNIVIRSLPGFNNTAYGIFVGAGWSIIRQSNCLLNQSIQSIMTKLNLELGLNIIFDSLTSAFISPTTPRDFYYPDFNKNDFS